MRYIFAGDASSSPTRNIFKLICELAFERIMITSSTLACSCVLSPATFSARLESFRAFTKVRDDQGSDRQSSGWQSGIGLIVQELKRAR